MEGIILPVLAAQPTMCLNMKENVIGVKKAGVADLLKAVSHFGVALNVGSVSKCLI